MANSLALTLILASLCLSAHPSAASPQSLNLTGIYTRVKHRRDENQSATLAVTQTKRRQIKFDLTALWWPVGCSDSPHNGEIEAVSTLHNQVAIYKQGSYRLALRFQKHRVVLTESGRNPEFGENVSAAGTYRRTRRYHAPRL